MNIQTHQLAFIRKEEVAKNTFAFYFEKPEEFTYEAGQYIMLSLINPPEDIDQKGPNRSMSLGSAPHENELMITMRMSDSTFKTELNAFNSGDKIEIKGPLGHLTLDKNSDKPIIFLGGGVGIVPLLSMIRAEKENSFNRPITLFYSNNSKEETSFYKELTEINHDNFKLVCTVTGEQPEGWQEESGFINAEMIANYISKPEEHEYYIVGPNPMVHAMVDALQELSVPEENINKELFGNDA